MKTLDQRRSFVVAVQPKPDCQQIQSGEPQISLAGLRMRGIESTCAGNVPVGIWGLPAQSNEKGKQPHRGRDHDHGNNLDDVRTSSPAFLETTTLSREAHQQSRQCLVDAPVMGASANVLLLCAPWWGSRERSWFDALFSCVSDCDHWTCLQPMTHQFLCFSLERRHVQSLV